jgi:hypothetical protein
MALCPFRAIPLSVSLPRLSVFRGSVLFPRQPSDQHLAGEPPLPRDLSCRDPALLGGCEERVFLDPQEGRGLGLGEHLRRRLVQAGTADHQAAVRKVAVDGRLDQPAFALPRLRRRAVQSVDGARGDTDEQRFHFGVHRDHDIT